MQLKPADPQGQGDSPARSLASSFGRADSNKSLVSLPSPHLFKRKLELFQFARVITRGDKEWGTDDGNRAREGLRGSRSDPSSAAASSVQA
jgi:hypothetical protein